MNMLSMEIICKHLKLKEDQVDKVLLMGYLEVAIKYVCDYCGVSKDDVENNISLQMRTLQVISSLYYNGCVKLNEFMRSLLDMYKVDWL